MSTQPTIISRRSILALLIGLIGWTVLAPAPAAAQSIDFSTPIPLQGYAWSAYEGSDNDSEGVGWISMSCESDPDCSDPDGYGVEVQTDGSLTGYAWSNVGWIKFGGLSGWPTTGGTQQQNAELLPNGQMRGWARACSATVGGDCSDMATDPNADGWDGWISLRGNGGGADGYGIQFSTSQQPDGSYEVATGGSPGDRYAWGGSTVMGWIDFSQVTLGGTPPPTGGTDFITADDCTIDVGDSTCDTTIQWDASSYGNPRISINQGIGDVLFDDSPVITGTDTYSLSGANSSYTVTLREGGTTIDTAVVQVSCEGSSDWDPGSGTCQIPDPDKPDLVVQNLSSNTGSYNEVTGEYSNVDFLFRIRNIGATTTAYEGESSVEWDMEYNESVWPVNDTLDGSTPAIDDGTSRQVTADAGTLIFGIYTFSAEADPSPPTGGEIDEEVEGNNTGGPATVTLYPQDPDMVLTTVSSQIVRSGDQAEIRWDTVAEYPMDCTLSGPGISTQTFDPSTDGTTGTVTTSPRYNTSIYTMTCDVDYPGIDRTFNASTRVEVIPRLEEI